MKKQHTKGELSLITMKYKTNPKEIITGIGISEKVMSGVYSNALFSTIIPETDKEYIKEHDQIKADSEHIVKCWNMHDGMLKELKRLKNFIENLEPLQLDVRGYQLKKINEAIKKATESNLNPVFEQLTKPFNPNKT